MSLPPRRADSSTRNTLSGRRSARRLVLRDPQRPGALGRRRRARRAGRCSFARRITRRRPRSRVAVRAGGVAIQREARRRDRCRRARARRARSRRRRRRTTGRGRRARSGRRRRWRCLRRAGCAGASSSGVAQRIEIVGERIGGQVGRELDRRRGPVVVGAPRDRRSLAGRLELEILAGRASLRFEARRRRFVRSRAALAGARRRRRAPPR